MGDDGDGGRARVYGNAAVYTLDPRRPLCEALAARDGRVVAVGSLAEAWEAVGAARAGAGPLAEEVDLGGGAVVPGLVDCHVHLLELGLRLGRVDVSGARSPEEAAARVKDALAGREGQEGREGPVGQGWVLGGGWDKSLWGGDFPRREVLDAVAGGCPVCLQSKDIHAAWASSAALAAAGIGAATADPPGGRIVRDPGGDPTGVLLERAVDLVSGAIPRPALPARVAALRRAIALLHRLGLVGAHNCEGAQTLSALQVLETAGELRLRVVEHIAAAELESALALGLRTGLGGEWLRIGGVKAFADGALGSQTAACLKPYAGMGDWRGVTVTPAAEMVRLAERAAAGGIALTIHAIGDAAVRAALDAAAAARRVEGAGGVTGPHGGLAPLRHRVEHIQLLDPADRGRFKELGVIASMQPAHATSDRDIADRYWGDRCSGAYPWRSLLLSGARLCFGSDAPVEYPDPRLGLFAAITRRRPADDASWYPAQRLTFAEALAAYTTGAACAAGQMARRGRLQVGMAADFTVFDSDVGALPPEALLEARVVMTVAGGEVVYAA
jgi:hypothetical protein